MHDELIRTSPRFVPTATLPLQSVELSIKEVQRCAGLGFRAIFLPTEPAKTDPYWNDDHWEPLWSAIEEAGLVIGVHIGTDADGTRPYRNPGGALFNYLDTTFGGQKAAAQFVSGGALERHPKLRVLISEGGATWAPFVGDRLNEAYRQHPMFDDGRLPKPPKEYIMEQVYASFQHDETAVPAYTAMGFRNILFGTDYPHIEGTYPHTQKVLARDLRRRRRRRELPHPHRRVPRALPQRRRTGRARSIVSRVSRRRGASGSSAASRRAALPSGSSRSAGP